MEAVLRALLLILNHDGAPPVLWAPAASAEGRVVTTVRARAVGLVTTVPANVRKHAHASMVGVVLARRPHGVELEITDDGTGFLAGESTGFGLDGMRKRLAELGGRLTVTSSVGDATRILAMIPMAGEVEA